MTSAEIAAALAGPHQAVLSVARPDRGPLAIPMSYVLTDGVFKMVTPPDSRHGLLMQAEGRATMTIHYEEYPEGRAVLQWYVMAEGPVTFTDEDPVPLVRIIMEKDRGEVHGAAWAERSPPGDSRVAVLTPQTLYGRRFTAQLD
jgi:hypothetical protein